MFYCPFCGEVLEYVDECTLKCYKCGAKIDQEEAIADDFEDEFKYYGNDFSDD